MTLIQRNVEQLRREGIKNSKQFKEQKNFYDTDQALTEFEDMLQSNQLITHKSKYFTRANIRKRSKKNVFW